MSEYESEPQRAAETGQSSEQGLSSEQPNGDSPVDDGVQQARSRRSRGATVGIIIAAVVGGLVVLAGAAVAVFVLTSGRGPQPEAAMPADTIAFVKLDLDPSAGQKVNALRFLRDNLPDDAGVEIDPESDDPIGAALSSLGAFDDVDFRWEQIDAWVGDRAAVAALRTEAGDIAPVGFIRVDDEAAMDSFFAKYAPDVNFAMVREGYAVIAEDKQTVDMVKASTSWLADSADYQADMTALGGGQILTAWADLPAVIAAQQNLSDLTGTSLPSTGDVDVQGRLAMGLTVEPDVLELLTVADGLVVDGQTPPWMPATSDLGSLPDNVMAAVSMGGLGDYLSDVLELDSVRQQVPDLEDDIALQFGVGVDDLLSVLSTTATVFAMESPDGLGETPLVGVRLVENDGTTESSVESLVQAAGALEALRIEHGDGSGGTSYVQLSAQEQADPFTSAEGSGQLSGTPAFQKVVVGDAALAAYVNMTMFWDYLAAQSADSETYRNITAAGLGYEMGDKGSNSSRLRLRVAFDGKP